MTAGAPAIISTSPAGSGLLLDNQVTTVGADQPTRVVTQRMPGWSMLIVRGQVAMGSQPRLLFAAVENPTTMFLSAFREALSRKGIFVGGSAIDIDDLRTPPDRSKAETWVIDQSAPLFTIVDPLFKRSRNGYAETLLWTLSPPGEPATDAAGLEAMRDTLAELGVAPERYRSFDGSGLSRYDMVSAETLTRLLTVVWNDPEMLGPFRNALPVAGVAGSLASQLKDTAAAGRVWAKTGSMFNISTLSGYALTADNEPVAFSFLANNFTAPAAEIDAMMDDALLALATFSRDE
jgi:D-alanyl-D-alanine carboxypeptidase/D-alanyl-D-alanine-endopeptidase (penicillin-binding protein 4)